jgi:hypothetical protein
MMRFKPSYDERKLSSNQLAGAAAGWQSQVIEMTQVVLRRRSGSAPGSLGRLAP